MSESKPQGMHRKSILAQVLAWGVHFYTGLGLVAAGGMAVLIVQGGANSFRLTFFLMLIATLIDATDGTLARRVRVKEVLPGFDGRRLDDIIDFLTYTCLPLLLVWQSGLVSTTQAWWLLFPLLASAYGFCQVSAKTDDGYFLGFPSYWNLVAFYLYLLRLPEWLTVALLLLFALLTFVPTRYLYPTQPGRLNQVTNLLAAVWVVLVLWILWRLPSEGSAPERADDFTLGIVLVSLAFPAYYLIASWAITLKVWRRRRLREGFMEAVP